MKLTSCALPLALFALIENIPGIDLPSSGLIELPTSVNNRVRRETSCKASEYFHEELCCQRCPPGTHVFQHCQTHGGKSNCAPCQSRKKFTEAANGLKRCLTCGHCREDQETVHICTSSSNTVCQCKLGRFCIPIEPCEYCQKCTERCPKGKVIIQECSATSDTVCGTEAAKTGGSFQGMYLIILIILVPLFIVGAGLRCQRRRRRRKKQTSFGHINPSEEKESGESVQNPGAQLLIKVPVIPVIEPTTPLATTGSSLTRPHLLQSTHYIPVCQSDVLPVNKPSSVTECTIHLAVNHVSSKTLENQAEPADTTVLQFQNEQPIAEFGEQSLNWDMYPDVVISDEDAPIIFHTFINEVPLESWKMFMRILLLKDNIINAAIQDNPNNVNEQHYEMLVKWRVTFGNKATINRLLFGLREIKLIACYEDIVNELISHGILNRHDSKLTEVTD